MMLLDVNVLIYAYWPAAPQNAAVRPWLETAVAGNEPVVVPGVVLSALVRILTGARGFAVHEPLENALEFVRWIVQSPAVLVGHGGGSHVTLFCDLCERTRTVGNRVSDAYLAAMAIEAGATLVSFDSDFGRFPGLTWRHLPGGQVITNPS
jgi:toxin-antitoxin system PIN domain toxin